MQPKRNVSSRCQVAKQKIELKFKSFHAHSVLCTFPFMEFCGRPYMRMSCVGITWHVINVRTSVQRKLLHTTLQKKGFFLTHACERFLCGLAAHSALWVTPTLPHTHAQVTRLTLSLAGKKLRLLVSFVGVVCPSSFFLSQWEPTAFNAN